MNSILILISVLVLLNGCTSTQDLRAQRSCSVWKDQGALGPYEVKVNQRRVTANTKCLLMFWWCSSFESHIDNEGRIFAKGSWGSERQVATLKDNQVVYESSFADLFAKSSPVQLDMTHHTAKRTVELAIIKGPKDEEKLEFNASCSKQEAAVGAVSLWILQNTRG